MMVGVSGASRALVCRFGFLSWSSMKDVKP